MRKIQKDVTCRRKIIVPRYSEVSQWLFANLERLKASEVL
jgi:hypothetical protein